ncbi:MAG: MoaD/ThiS family protein [Acidimicrobiia bacterium]
MVRLRLFASLRETAGTAEAQMPGSTVGEVISRAIAKYGDQFERHLEHARIWLNGDPASLDDRVSEGDELALLPPVSGGSLAVPAGLDQQGIYVGLVFLVLAVTAIVPERAWFAAAVVGVAAVWIVDLAAAAGARQLGLNEFPLLGAVFVAGVAAAAYGANGLGLAVMASVVLVVAWAVLVLRERDLVAISSNMGVAVVAALATSGLIVTHAPGAEGNALIGMYLATMGAAGLVSWALARSTGRPLIDPITGGSLAGVAAALIAGWLWDIALAGVLVVAIGLVIALVSGRGLGSLVRTGNIYLVDRLPGRLVALDGPAMAAAVLYPLVRLLI